MWNSAAITPVTYSGSAAIIGALSVCQAKALSEVVTLLFPPCVVNVFTEPYLYMTLFMLAAAGGFWLNRSIAALGLYDPNFIIPLLQSSYIVFTTISSGVFFQEFAPMANEWWRWPLFISGLGVMLCGLYGLFSAGQKAQAAHEEELTTRRANAHGKVPLPGGVDLANSRAGDDDEERDKCSDLSSRDQAGTYATNYGGPPGVAPSRQGTFGSESGVAIGPEAEDRWAAARQHSREGSRERSGTGLSPHASERNSSARDDGCSTPRTPVPVHPHHLTTRDRSASRSRMAFEVQRTQLDKQLTSGTFAEVLHRSRLSKNVLDSSFGDVDVGQSANAAIFYRPAATPRKSVSARDSWTSSSRRHSGDHSNGMTPRSASDGVVTDKTNGGSTNSL